MHNFFWKHSIFKELVQTPLKKIQKKVQRDLLINGRAINYIDSTASEQLYELILALQKKGIRVMFVGAIGPARDVILKSKIIKILKKQNLFITSGDATDVLMELQKNTSTKKIEPSK